MIISRGRGYVFVHIPKTGGTSLALALESRAMRRIGSAELDHPLPEPEGGARG